MNLRRVISMFLLLVLQSQLTRCDEKYEIKQLNNDETIYLETLGRIKIYHEQWKIVVGYELSDLEHNFVILKTTYEELYKKCFHTIDKRDWICSSRKRISKRLQRFNEIASDLENVLHLAGFKNSIRTKRGLFDFVGEVSKTLFGTLSDTDATYYNNELDKLYSDQKSHTVCKKSD